MDLSKAQRAILINQFEILKQLNPGGERHYDEQLAVLEGGYTIFYDDVVSVAEDASEALQQWVLDLLTLYRIIGNFLTANAGSELVDHRWAQFRGFDGNEETEYYAFTRFLVEDYGRFAELKDTELNSHASFTLPKYQAMFAAWEALGRPTQLTEDQARTILDAGN